MAGSIPPPVAPQAPPVGGGPVALDRASAKRTEEVVRYIEREVRNSPAVARRGGGGINPGALAVLGGSLSAATSSTAPTSASATFRKFDGTTISADTDVVTVYNFHNKTFASGGLVALMWAAGYWWVVDSRDCPT